METKNMRTSNPWIQIDEEPHVWVRVSDPLIKLIAQMGRFICFNWASYISRARMCKQVTYWSHLWNFQNPATGNQITIWSRYRFSTLRAASLNFLTNQSLSNLNNNYWKTMVSVHTSDLAFLHHLWHREHSLCWSTESEWSLNKKH